MMMLPSLAFLLLAPTPATATARLVGASMFKNGFAVTQRIVDVPQPGTTTVVPVPQGALGTLWFTPSEGTTLDSVVVENEALPSTYPAATVDAVLTLNLNRPLTLTLLEAGTASKLTCRVTSVNGTIVVVQTAAGTTRVIARSAVVGVEGKGLVSTGAGSGSRRVMRIHTLGKPGRVAIVALERGLTWAPAYAVNLLPGGKELSLVAKATVVNDLERLTDLDCRFVTGFPHLPFAQMTDPLVQYVGLVGGMGGGGGFGGGGLGGGGFGSQFANGAAAPAPVGYREEDKAMLDRSQAPDGTYLEELFFYHRPNVSVDVAGRAAYTLFRTQVPYDTLYTWDLPDPAPGQPRFDPSVALPQGQEVWQTLLFKNDAKLPLTTAPATVFSDGQIVGQDTIGYTSPGGPVELKVTQSLDLAADFLEEEAGRERGFIRFADNNFRYDRLTVKGTLTLVNRKAKAVKVRIRKSFTGEWLSGEGNPVVTATAAGLRQVNPTGRAEWTTTLEPGATLKLTYATRMLVNS